MCFMIKEVQVTGLDYKNTQSLKRSGVTGVSKDAEEYLFKGRMKAKLSLFYLTQYNLSRKSPELYRLTNRQYFQTSLLLHYLNRTSN